MDTAKKILTLEEKVQQLWDIKEIKSVLNCYSRGFERFDIETAQNTYWPEARDDHPGFVGPAHEMCAWADHIHKRQFDSNQHYITNNEIEVSGDTAHTESYFIHGGSPERFVRDTACRWPIH